MDYVNHTREKFARVKHLALLFYNLFHSRDFFAVLLMTCGGYILSFIDVAIPQQVVVFVSWWFQIAPMSVPTWLAATAEILETMTRAGGFFLMVGGGIILHRKWVQAKKETAILELQEEKSRKEIELLNKKIDRKETDESSNSNHSK